MFSIVILSYGKATNSLGPIREYFWAFPETELLKRCTIKTRRFHKTQEQSQSTEQSNIKLPKHDMKRSKRRNHARVVKKCPDSSTESNSEEDYAYAVQNKGDPKTKITVCISLWKINFIVDTGVTVDVIDSKTFSHSLSRPDMLLSAPENFYFFSKIYSGFTT